VWTTTSRIAIYRPRSTAALHTDDGFVGSGQARQWQWHCTVCGSADRGQEARSRRETVLIILVKTQPPPTRIPPRPSPTLAIYIKPQTDRCLSKN
jgi:hypothetical protein